MRCAILRLVYSLPENSAVTPALGQLELNARFVSHAEPKTKKPSDFARRAQENSTFQKTQLLGRPLKRRIATLVRAARKQCHQPPSSPTR